jgi:hypothetical protein
MQHPRLDPDIGGRELVDDRKNLRRRIAQRIVSVEAPQRVAGRGHPHADPNRHVGAGPKIETR